MRNQGTATALAGVAVNTDTNTTNQATNEVSLTARILMAAALFALLATIGVRWVVKEQDGGLANVLTLIMGFVTWALAVLGLMVSPWPRAYWQALAAAPFIVGAVALSMFRFKRFDGELVPQWESRWLVKAELPQGKPASAAAADVELIPSTSRTVSLTDYPQFLGKQRSGVIDQVQLDTNWSGKPPEVLWKQPIGAGWSGFAVQGDVAVTMEQRDQEQWVSAYDVPTGKLYWQVPFPGSHFNVLGGAGPRATPTIVNDKVFTQTATGQVACIDLATSQVLWQVDLLKLGEWDQAASEAAISWGRSGSPLVTDSLVVVPFGAPASVKERGLIALDKKSGDVRWRAGDDQISYSSPSLTRLLDKDQIVIVNEASVTGHEIETGKVLWSVPWDGHSNSSASCSQTITISPTQLLISKGYSQGAKLVEFAVDGQGQWSSTTVWEEAGVLKTKFTSPVVLGEFAFGLSDGRMECVRVADGKRQWKGRGYGHGQLLLVGDTLLIMAEQGELALVAADPKQFTQLARMPALSGVTWNVPTLSGDRLLIRNSDEAACIKLPLR